MRITRTIHNPLCLKIKIYPEMFSADVGEFMQYDVIIVGGGPVALALGIELGLNNIKTLILEKHGQPLRSPRAQSLSARTMEFCMRWGVDKILEENLLLPKDFPNAGIWCSNLNGKTYFTGSWGDYNLTNNVSPKIGLRIPLWVTENVLRQRLQDFPSIDFHLHNEVVDLKIVEEEIHVKSYDKIKQTTLSYQSSFLACADGANGLSKSKFNNKFKALSGKSKMLGTLFTAKEIMKNKTVPDGSMYFIISKGAMAFVGPIDFKESLWLAQIVWDDTLEPNKNNLGKVIDNIVGKPIEKEIIDHYVWEMQVQLADFFSLKNRVFWLGDAAHAFAPTGGLGLNTGFGDAQNLGWKLVQVVQKQLPSTILSSYEMERRPVCMNNLNFTQQSADEFLQLKNSFSSEIHPQSYDAAFAEIGNRFLSSSGLTLGYGYFESPLVKTLDNQTFDNDPFQYSPKVEPGYFLPHTNFQNKSIYEQLTATKWNLIISEAKSITQEERHLIAEVFPFNNLNIVLVPPNTYPYIYILLRPDWHIAHVTNQSHSIQSFDFLKEIA